MGREASNHHTLLAVYVEGSKTESTWMALLNETVPSCKETWIEFLGDLGRYQMAIRDDDTLDREIWTDVSRKWYQLNGSSC